MYRNVYIESSRHLMPKELIIEMNSVKSSNINSVGYDGIGTLRVRFNNSNTYQYDGVPKEIYESMVSSPSIGSFFSKFIRNQFPCTKVQ